MVSIGRTKKDAEIAADIAEQNISVISKIQETSHFKTISKKDLFEMEYWSLEQAKLKEKSKLSGKYCGYNRSPRENWTCNL